MSGRSGPAVWRTRPPNPRYIWSLNQQKQAATSTQVGVANQAHQSAIYVDYPCTVDQMTMNISTGSAGSGIFLGLYKPLVTTPFSPLAATRLGVSAEIDAANAAIKVWTISTPIRLTPGYYYGSLVTEDGTQQFRRSTANAIYDDAAAEFLKGSIYDVGSFAAPVDPCPAITESTAASFVFVLRVSVWG